MQQSSFDDVSGSMLQKIQISYLCVDTVHYGISKQASAFTVMLCHGALQQKEMMAVVVSCCVYDKCKQNKHQLRCTILYMCDQFQADRAVNLLLLKRAPRLCCQSTHCFKTVDCFCTARLPVAEPQDIWNALDKRNQFVEIETHQDGLSSSSIRTENSTTFHVSPLTKCV